MCKLESIKWIIVKSNKKISKSLSRKIARIITTSPSTIDNRLYFYTIKTDFKIQISELLKGYKKQKFEIVEFTDKQFGLTLNLWKGGDASKFNDLVNKLPLSKKFFWNNLQSDLISVTPITENQFKNIIYIN